MTYDIHPAAARGTVTAPPSKSVAHRYLIAAALADGVSEIRHVPHSEDIEATIACLCAMGARCLWDGDTVTVVGGILASSPRRPLTCRECGTTLRLMLPLCLLGNGTATLTGTEKLLSRPLGAYETLCRERHFLWEQTKDSVTVSGQLTAGDYFFPGNVSSQYISGMIFALSCLEGESHIYMTTRVESRPYIDLTLDALSLFGGEASWSGERALRIVGRRFRPADVTVEGDWSNASTWLAMQTLGDTVELVGLRADSLQGDRVIVDYLAALAAGTPTLSIADCPDLAPTLMASAALLHGATLTDTARLKLKESDRGEAMREELAKCGVVVTVEENRIIIPDGARRPSVPLAGHRDHRIVMAGALLLSRLGGRIKGCEAVAKSYPDFFEVLHDCGIEVDHV